jgi:hypothetical protein
MITVGPHDSNGEATQYLQTLCSLVCEVKTALHAISQNALSDFEESVADQAVLSSRLAILAGNLSASRDGNLSIPQTHMDDDLKRQIRVAAEELQQLNRGYAALLQYSSHSGTMMASLVASFNGQFQEASGSGSQYQTWSCQM